VFIELTDQLRCPADHDESFLVLLPDEMDGRSVRTGQLGCPVCGRTYPVVDGVLDTQDATPAEGLYGSVLDADSATTLVGLHGPGGYLVLVGPVASAWKELGELNPGVALVAVNPNADVADAPGISVLRGARLPIRSRAMRGVILGRPFAADRHWVREAARVVLPGLRIVGEGRDPPPELIDLMASAEGVWVGTRSRD
jgi:uncharacterized protein YbaR (Trm112 family)